jgi:hypothetical protein
MRMSELALWRQVIDQAIADATLTDTAPAPQTAKARARLWLTRPNKDFSEVCGLALLEPDAVRIAARKQIEIADAKPAKPVVIRKPRQLLEHDGQRRGLLEWARLYGINHHTLYSRITKQGMTMAEALTTPNRQGTRSKQLPGVLPTSP